jgi:Flp pilus assembly protein TadB
MNGFAFSPFIVPVAGCMVGIVAIVAGIWLEGHKRRMKSEERIAMIARGVPLAEIEKMLGAGDEEKPSVKDPLRSLGNARRAGIVLVSVGAGLILFGLVLTVILQVREVLAVAAAGLIPLAIGIGFFIDYHLQKRELSRFGLEVGAELPGGPSHR